MSVYPNCTCVPGTAGNHVLTCPVSTWMAEISKKFDYSPKPMGWICPVCSCGVAPAVERCPCSVVKFQYLPPGTTITPVGQITPTTGDPLPPLPQILMETSTETTGG